MLFSLVWALHFKREIAYIAANDENNYFEKRKINCINRMDSVIEELPYFCREFFIGIENNTSPLTRLNYAMDLRIFFDFLVKKF